MKQYLLSVHMVEGEETPPPEVMQEAYDEGRRLQPDAAGRRAPGCSPAASTRRRRRPWYRSATVRSSPPTVPFAETKEQLGGFWVIAAEDLDAALAWAAQATRACGGPVEVRPFQDEPGE